MRISEIIAQFQVRKGSNAERLSAASVQPVAGKPDHIELSAEAQGILNALKAAREADPTDAQRVEELSSRIRKGTYNVSAADVADRILGK